jgi:hypothetical protein
MVCKERALFVTDAVWVNPLLIQGLLRVVTPLPI